MLPRHRSCLLSLLLFAPSVFGCVQFHHLTLPESVVSGVRPVSLVRGVPNISTCAQVCLLEASCSAAQLNATSRRCSLLTARFTTLETVKPAAEGDRQLRVWAVIGRHFGECPASYKMAWKTSRYRLSDDKQTKEAAEQHCRREGGFVAELTTPEEVDFVVASLRAIAPMQPISFFLGGVKIPGVKEPRHGFQWQNSNLPVTSVGWNKGEPNNGEGNEVFLEGYVPSDGKMMVLNDIGPSQMRRYMCECYSLM